MAKENPSFEDDSKKKSKSRLIVAIILALIILALMITGVVLYYVLRDREGTIDFEGTNVDIRATGEITGMEENPVLEPIVIDAESQTGTQSWRNLNLVFENKDAVITLTITVVNNNDYNSLSIIFDNNTTQDNVNIEQTYYCDGHDYNQLPLDETAYILEAQQSITYVVNFTIKDELRSVSDTLDINIICTNIEV